MRRRGRNRVLTLQDCVRRGEAGCLYPATDTGYRAYENGRLFLPAATNLCVDPQGTAATFWGAGTVHTAIVPNTSLPLPITDQPFITKCVKLTNNGTADAPVTANITVAASTPYNCSLYAYCPEFGGNVTITAENGHTFTVAALTGAMSGWTRYSVQSNTVAGEVVLGLKFAFAGGSQSTLYVTGFNPVASAVLTPYFDGSYPSCAWTGVANASTSTRAVSALAYQIASTGPFSMPANAYTVAMSWSSLAASASQPANCYLFDLLGNGHEACQLADFWGGGYMRHSCYDGVNNPSNPNLTFTWTAGGSNALIARNGDGVIDYRNCGVTRAQVADTTTRVAPTLVSVGSSNGAGSACHIGHIGPLAISPSRITDAETALLDAMLTAGATGLDLFRWFRGRGYSGTLIIPLNGDSVGYVVR